MAASEPQGIEKRDYFRVETQLPLRARLVCGAERPHLEREILASDPKESNEFDPQLAAWLDRLESKLDRVLKLLGEDGADLRPTETHDVVISGSGIGLAMTGDVESEACVLLDFELPGPPAHRVRCLGTVVRADARPDGSSEVAAAYIAIREEDREAIIRHTLDVERFALRSRSALREDA